MDDAIDAWRRGSGIEWRGECKVEHIEHDLAGTPHCQHCPEELEHVGDSESPGALEMLCPGCAQSYIVTRASADPPAKDWPYPDFGTF